MGKKATWKSQEPCIVERMSSNGRGPQSYNSQGTDTSAVAWIYALNPATGDSLWRIELNNGIGVVSMSPVIENDTMYIGTSWTEPFSVEAWDLSTQQRLWHYDLPRNSYLCDQGMIIDDMLILSLAPYAIGGWNKHTGEQVWKDYATHNYNWSRMGYDGRYLYYQHGWKLQVIEPGTGEIIYSTWGPDGESVYSIAVTAERIFINGFPHNMCWTTYQP